MKVAWRLVVGSSGVTLIKLKIICYVRNINLGIHSMSAFREFLGQAWTKADKAERAPHILRMTGHFNHISSLVISEIMKKNTMAGKRTV